MPATDPRHPQPDRAGRRRAAGPGSPAAGDRHSHRRQRGARRPAGSPGQRPVRAAPLPGERRGQSPGDPRAALAGDQRSALCRRAAGAAGKLLLQRPPGYPAAAEHCHRPPAFRSRTGRGKPADAPHVPDRPARPDPRTEPLSQPQADGPRAGAPRQPARRGGPFAAVLDRRRGDRVDRRWPTVAAQVAQATVLAHRPRAQAIADRPGLRGAAPSAQGTALPGGAVRRPGPAFARGPRTAWAGAAAVHRPPAGRGIAAPVRPRPVGDAFAVHGDPRGTRRGQGHARPDRARRGPAG